MTNAMRWIGGAVLGIAVAAAAPVVAAVGDIIYERQPVVVAITTAHALTVADWAIARGCWDGDRADLQHVEVSRVANGSGFTCAARGNAIAAPNAVPIGVRVVGYVE